MKKTGKEDLIMKLKAGYCYFYVQTNEILETVEETKTINGNYQTVIWDFDITPDPEAVLELLRGTERNTVIIGKNWNWFLQDGFEFNKAFCSFLQNNSSKFSSREYRKSLVIVSDQNFSKAIPECLQKDFCEVSFPLPNQEEIKALLENICKTASTSKKFQMPDDKMGDLIVQELKGLTAREIENALSYCLIKHSGEFDINTLAEIKAAAIERTAGLKLGQYSETFKDIKGYENLKEFVMQTINSNLSKGIILLGPAGVGKTTFIKALGNEIKKKTIIMEVAELFGGLVGESEKLMKTALDFIRANAPCILMIDKFLSM